MFNKGLQDMHGCNTLRTKFERIQNMPRNPKILKNDNATDDRSITFLKDLFKAKELNKKTALQRPVNRAKST